MQQVTLGRTGLRSSSACLGAGGHSRLGQSHGASHESWVALVKAAIDLGISMIDTAGKYGTEPIIAEAVKGIRDQVIISTKAAIVDQDEREGYGSGLKSAAAFTEMVEEGLRNLKTDYIDIMHLHGVGAGQYDYCRDELIPAFIRLREAGKIRFFGITERFNIDFTHEMLRLAARDDVWDVIMAGYNFLNQTAVTEVLPLSRENGIGTMCMYAVRGGLADHRRAGELTAELLNCGEIDRDTFDADDPLGFLSENGRRIPITEAAYRFCRHTPGIDVVMTGTGSLEHLKQNIAPIEAPPLPVAVADRLRAMFGKVTSQSGNPLTAAG
jgi:aryl-alcohol dehydrogenase-like predicted oxidoreductase